MGRNITTKDLPEKAVRQALKKEAMLDQAGLLASVGAWEIEIIDTVDINSNALYWSDEVYRIFGYQPGEVEVTNRLFLNHVHPDDRIRVAEAFKAAVVEKKDYSIEHRIIRTDASTRHLKEYAQMNLDEQGMVRQVLGAVQDITEQKQLEEELVESRRFVQRIIDSSLNGLYIYDLNKGKIIYISPQYVQLTGYTLEKFKDMSSDEFLKLFHPDDRQRVIDHVRQAAKEAGSKVREIEYRFKRSDGKWIWCLSRETPFSRGEDGSVYQYLGTFLDVTERKYAEQALRASEEKYRLLFESIDEGFCIIKVLFDDDQKPFDFRLIEVNPSFINQTGIRDPIGRRMREIAPDHEQQWFDIYGQVAITGEPKRFQSSARALDRFFDVYAFRIGGAKQRLVAVLFDDISQQKKAEEALIESKAKLEAAIKSMTDAVFISDAQGRFIDFNEAFVTFHRFKDRKQASKMLIDYPKVLEMFFMDGTKAPVEKWSVPRALRGETRVGEEYIVRRKDTGETWFGSYSFAPIRDNKNMIIGAVVVGRDITGQKRAEKDLRESEEKFRELVEAPNSIIMSIDKDLNILYINDFGLKFFGYTLEELIGRNVAGTIISKKDEEGRDLSLMLKDIVRYPEKYKINVHQNTRKNGELVWVSWTNRPKYDKDGNLTGFLAIGNDVSRLKKTESELKKEVLERKLTAVKLEQALAERNTFVSRVSHELRTPLTAIKQGIELVLRGVTGKVNSEQEELLDLASRNVERLNSLIGDVLDFQRLQSGKVEMAFEKNDINKLLQEVYQTMRVVAERKGLVFNVKIQDQPLYAWFDYNKIAQVLNNLVSNAVKFTDQGRITISAKRAQASVRVSVEDTGVGIKKEDLGKLFKEFTQVGVDARKKIRGTGLGLIISKKIMQAHGGEIWIESEPGKGTKVSFEIPIRER